MRDINNKIFTILLAAAIFAPLFSYAAQLEIKVSPSEVLQGEPAWISVSGESDIRSISLNGHAIPFFFYKGRPSALVGIDIAQKPGSYEVEAKLRNGAVATTSLPIKERKKYEAVFDIPEKLGGNSTSSQKKLVATLSKENSLLASVRTGKKSYWSTPFRAPLATSVVTDEYGYSRKTGETAITHKGTDFRAAEGTKVYAMNRGIVRLARSLGIYGKTVVIDHGLGVQTMYMHLSKIVVNEGELVRAGQFIGKSGKTGYAEFPHLHVSVRIGGVSVDPMKFLALFAK